MAFDFQWLLLGFPLAFALGWLGSRMDLRQWRKEQRESPKAYFKGLNLLLNEQQDKAIDAFIEAVQHDPDTTELHFALGNLFRRRGEFERAVRVHEHLLNRADLAQADRDRAQYALAQDFMKAGLFDRAEQAYRAVEGQAFGTEARLALLTLHERSRSWRTAVEVAQELERTGAGSFASRIAHYWCELSLEADANDRADDADMALRHARKAAPHLARPLVLAGLRASKRGDHVGAMKFWAELQLVQPAAFNLVAKDFAQSAIASDQANAGLARLKEAYQQAPTMQLLNAIALVEGAPDAHRQRLFTHLLAHRGLSASHELLRDATATQQALDAAETQGLLAAVEQAAKPLLRYRCAACGFEAHHYFWQCPGCLSWDSYPPQLIEDL